MAQRNGSVVHQFAGLAAGTTGNVTVAAKGPCTFSGAGGFLGGLTADLQKDWTASQDTCSTSTYTLSVTNVVPSYTSVSPGQLINIAFKVQNTGTGLYPSFSEAVYWSNHASITTSDSQLASQTISSLTAGASRNDSLNMNVPSGVQAGVTYYVGVIADGNFASSGVAVTVAASPSLTVTVLDASGLPAPGVSVKLYNGSSLVSTQPTNSSGQAPFSGLTNGTTYTAQAYKPGAQGQTEYWGSGSKTVSGATTLTVSRSTPYITAITFYNAASQAVGQGSTVSQNEQMRAVATVSSQTGNPTVQVLLRDGNGSPVATNCSGLQCTFTASGTGTYTRGAILTTTAQPTDTWDWTSTFAVASF